MTNAEGVVFYVEKGRAPVTPDWDASMRAYFVEVLTRLFIYAGELYEHD